MMQFSDEQNYNLADEVYKNEYMTIGTEIVTKDKSKWITINSVNDPSGLQAIAVVPLEDYEKMQAGKIDTYPNVVFSSRGSEQFIEDWLATNIGELGNIHTPQDIKNEHTDKQLGKINTSRQFLGYEVFVDQTLEDFEITDYSFTGHSLGGALAQYMAVLKDKNATTFAAARAYRLLPTELQAKVDAGEFDDQIVNYRHKLDPVGYLPAGKMIGLDYIVKSSKADIPIMGHLGSSFTGSFKNGSVQILFDPDAIRSFSNEMMTHYDSLNDMQLAFRQYIDYEEREIQGFLNEIRTSPEFDQLSPTEIDEILDEMFPYKVNGNYSVHNPEAGENIDLYTGIAKEKIYQFSEQLKKAADIAENSDKKVAKGIDTEINWFNSLEVSSENRGQDPTGNRPISS